MLDPSTQSIALYVNHATFTALLAATPTYVGNDGLVHDDIQAMWDEMIFNELNANVSAHLTLNSVRSLKDTLEWATPSKCAPYGQAALARMRSAVTEVPWDDTQLIDIG